MATQPLPADLVAWLTRRRQAGDDGKTMLIGLRGSDPMFAVVAGLRSADDEPRFLQFGRYLLHHRFDCDGHCVMLPAFSAERAAYLIAYQVGGPTRRWLWSDGGDLRSFADEIVAIGDWSRPEAALPGVMRRDFDALFEAVRVDPPDTLG